MRFNQFFPHQVCINLETRPDRWQRITARFIEQGMNQVVRFQAVDGKRLEMPSAWNYSPGAYGCLRSHLAVVEQARDEARPNVLIFEDDAVLAPDFTARFADYVKQLPDDWDMVFFGGLHGKPLIAVADNVSRVTHSLSTYAYALRHTIYDAFIEVNRQGLDLLDQNTRALQKQFNCYCFMPHLAWVEEDYSDVRGERSNLWWLKESLVLFGPQLDEVLQKTAAIISHHNTTPASQRNLDFTLDYLSQKLPTVTLTVLERGHRNGSRKRGVEMFDEGKDFFLFLDSDVFLTREDIIANLLKCRDYDFASSFLEIYDLNERDTLRILNGDVRWDYDNTYPVRKKASLCDSGCIITRKGINLVGGWAEFSSQSENQLSPRMEELLRVYHSPNRARRLSPG
jgi:glycosyl transferase, family 25